MLLAALLLVMAVVGVSVGVVIGRKRTQEQQQAAVAAALQQRARDRTSSGETLLYSINIKMAPDSTGDSGPTCQELFGGTRPQTVWLLWHLE